MFLFFFFFASSLLSIGLIYKTRVLDLPWFPALKCFSKLYERRPTRLLIAGDYPGGRTCWIGVSRSLNDGLGPRLRTARTNYASIPIGFAKHPTGINVIPTFAYSYQRPTYSRLGYYVCRES